MKKFILIVLAVAVLGGGYYIVQKFLRLNIAAFTGEIKATTRGDLVVPITASGYIKPASITQIKSKASGEVTQLPVDIGAMVKKGTLLIQLLDVDERRSKERAQSDYDRAQIAEAQARLRKKQAEGPGLNGAKAKLKSAQARQAKAVADFAFREDLVRQDGVPIPDDWTELVRMPKWPAPSIQKEEWVLYATSKMDADAAVLAAQADLAQANIAIENATQDIRNAEENVKGTLSVLNDANQRLIETTIVSPVDGMVLTRPVQLGEIVSSAKTTFTGGTVLMEIADINEIFAVVNVDEADIGQVHELAPVEARPGTATRPARRTDARPTTQPASEPAVPLATLPEGTLAEGQSVKIKVESFPDEEFGGVITQISPQSEVVQAVATFKVWIRINSSNVSKLVGLLNTQTEAHFTAKSVSNAVLAPYDAVQKNPDGDGYGVYVPVLKPGTNMYEPKFVKCKFGADNGLDIEVREGIGDGQKVYTKLPLKRDDKK